MSQDANSERFLAKAMRGAGLGRPTRPVVALLAMISASALYNAASSGRRREWLRRCDHAAIFFMIAGTYTPFTLVCMGGAWGFGGCSCCC